MHGWPTQPPGTPAWLGEAPHDTDAASRGLIEVRSRALDTMQAQISRLQLPSIRRHS